MNIIFLTTEYGENAGGLALTSRQLFCLLNECGHNVSVEIILDSSDYYVVEGGYDPLLKRKIDFSYKTKCIIEKYKNDLNIDLVIAYGAGQTACIGAYIANELKAMLYQVLCGSDINLAIGDAGLMYYNFWGIKHADKIVGLSRELIETACIINGGFIHDNYMVIPNYYDFSDLHYIQSKKQLSETLVFGTGSTFLSEKKGVSNLLHAISILVKKYQTNCKFYFFGKIDDDIYKRYIEIVNKFNISNYVKFCGYLRREDYLNSLNEVDIYLQASPFEGCPNSVAEAINAGKYVLLSNTGFFAEELREKFPGNILTTLKCNSLAEQLYSFTKFVRENDNRDAIYSYIKGKVSKAKVLNAWNGLLSRADCKNKRASLDKELIAVMFHDITNSYTGIDYEKDGFNQLVDDIKNKGYELCSFEKYKNSFDKTKLIVCTFDDGYENVYYYALPKMQEYGFTATVFVCPDLIGKNNTWNHRDYCIRHHMNETMIKELIKSGWEIGSHGLSHYNLLRLSQTELETCLLESKQLLQQRFNIDIKAFCYPYGEFKPYIENLVKNYYEAAFSVNYGGTYLVKDRYRLTRFVPEELKKYLGRQE